MMDRRTLLLAGAGFAVTNPAAAQQPKRLPVVALVTASTPVGNWTGSDPRGLPPLGFLQELRDLGWSEGRNVVVERRSAEGDPQRAPAVIAGLLASGVDVMAVAGATWILDAAVRAARTVSIVANFPEDPVAAGLVASLGRPGGNLTGVTLHTGPEFHAKQMQLLRELAPRVTRVAFLATRRTLEQSRDVTHPAGVTVVPVEAEHVGQYEAAFTAILREQAEAVLVGGGPVNYFLGPRIVAFAAQHQLPTFYTFRETAAERGLISYGPSVVENFRKMAKLVDKILKGAKPADLAVEQPTRFELVINAGTARALGLAVPPTLLALADEVIE
jgi:putative ABC transport system substrate-binding protein